MALLLKKSLLKMPLVEMEGFYSQGLSLVSLGGNDGKRPLMRFKGRKRLPLDVVITLMRKNDSAVYGILLHDLTVIDCDTDNEATSSYVKDKFGVSGFQVKTPRGRHHYFKKNDTIKGKIIRHPDTDIAIDLKSGANSYVVGPGSLRPDGGAYINDLGSYEYVNDIQNPPTPTLSEKQRLITIDGKIKQGSRVVDFLFRAARKYALLLDSEEELFEKLRLEVNCCCEDPETVLDSEIRGCTKWTWERRLKGELLGGNLSTAKIYQHEVEALLSYKNGSDALALFHILHHCHAAVVGKRFAIATTAMANAGFYNWSEWKIRRAKDTLLKAGFLKQVKIGGRGIGANLYQLNKLVV